MPLWLRKAGFYFIVARFFLYSLLAQNNTPLCTIYLLLALYYFEDIKSTGKRNKQQSWRTSANIPFTHAKTRVTGTYIFFAVKTICLSALCAIKYVLLFNVYENRRRFHFRKRVQRYKKIPHTQVYAGFF